MRLSARSDVGLAHSRSFGYGISSRARVPEVAKDFAGGGEHVFAPLRGWEAFCFGRGLAGFVRCVLVGHAATLSSPVCGLLGAVDSLGNTH